MRIVLQRVTDARVTVAGEVVGEVGPGWLALVGVAPADTEELAQSLAAKVANLRALADDAGKMDRSVLDVPGAGVLVVSNFTLLADCSAGRRPSFTAAARPEHAEVVYEAFLDGLRRLGVPTAAGRFGADMRVSLTNDGPVTFVLEA